MHDVIVVGSGAAAVAAMLGLAEHRVRPLVLDVGLGPRTRGENAPVGNLYQLRATHDTYALTIGERQQGLANLFGGRKVPVKLTTPGAEYVTASAAQLGPVEEDGFCAIQSFAMGGLANAWGAGLYRFTDRDMEGFPITAAELSPYFDRLTDEIGIAGAYDDLAEHLGSTHGLLPPLRLSRNIGRLYSAYQRAKGRLPPQFRLGRARVAALTVPHRDRPPIPYDSLEFWREHPGLYSPRYSLQDLIARDAVDYRGGVLVRSFSEDAEGVRVVATELSTGRELTHTAQHLVLAAGAINTARIVLQSYRDEETRLPLLENPALQIPFVMPAMIGSPLETDAFGLVQLNLAWDSETFGCLCQASLMEITSPARAEFFAGLPYSGRANLSLIRHLLPSMIVMQLFLPQRPESCARLSLTGGDRLRIQGTASPPDPARTAPLLSFMRRLGAWTSQRLIVRVPTGHAIHYAGTLPMSDRPGRYQCHPDGRLAGTRGVFVADSATLPVLPAKNMSFGMMANAMRVATQAAIATRERA